MAQQIADGANHKWANLERNKFPNKSYWWIQQSLEIIMIESLSNTTEKKAKSNGLLPDCRTFSKINYTNWKQKQL